MNYEELFLVFLSITACTIWCVCCAVNTSSVLHITNTNIVAETIIHLHLYIQCRYIKISIYKLCYLCTCKVKRILEINLYESVVGSIQFYKKHGGLLSLICNYSPLIFILYLQDDLNHFRGTKGKDKFRQSYKNNRIQ